MEEICDVEMRVFGDFDRSDFKERERFIMPECTIHFETLDSFVYYMIILGYHLLGFKSILW